MRASTAELLRCSDCQGALRLSEPAPAEPIVSGDLVCGSCSRRFPIVDEVVRMTTIEAVQQAYPDIVEQGRRGARLYEFLMARFAEIIGFRTEEGRAEYLCHLEYAPGRKVLDVGVGTGAELCYLLARHPDLQAYGLDISVDMMARCRQRLRHQDASAELVLAFAERMPFRDGVFDQVFHTGSINDCLDQRGAIAELVRVARPGARIVITDEWLHSGNTSTPSGKLLAETFPTMRTDSQPPVDCLPAGMQEVACQTIWRGFGYCLHFRKPA